MLAKQSYLNYPIQVMLKFRIQAINFKLYIFIYHSKDSFIKLKSQHKQKNVYLSLILSAIKIDPYVM